MDEYKVYSPTRKWLASFASKSEAINYVDKCFGALGKDFILMYKGEVIYAPKQEIDLTSEV